MSRLPKTLRWAESYPHLVVQFLLAVSLIAMGLYLAGPWYVIAPTAVFGGFLEAELVRVISGILYVVSGTINVYGLAKNSIEWRYWGTLAVFLSYMFITLLRLLAIGFFPITWVPTLTLGLIAAVKHIAESQRRIKANSDG